MSELSKVETTECSLKIGGRDRKIKFGFSAWAKIEKKYGGIKNLSKMEEDMKDTPFETIPFLIWCGLQDKEGLDEETFLDDFGLSDIEEVSEALAKALYGSLPSDAEEKKMTESR